MFEQAKHSLKPGDAIVTTMGVGILTRKTRTFWFYLFKNKIARIHKSQLWQMIDTGTVEVKYGNNNKYRRLKKTNRILDLVGITTERGEQLLNKFLDFIDLPCKILIGPDESKLEFIQEKLRETNYVFFVKDEMPSSPFRPIIEIISREKTKGES